MANVKWIKIVTDLFDDEKIKFIETMPNGDAYIVIWFKLLCLCGKSNCGGFLMFTSKLAYTDEMLSSIFSRDIKEIQMALKLFEKLEMIEISDNRICVANWEKHQSLDKLEAKKEYDREYQRKKREQNKLLIENRTSIARASNDNRSLDIEEDIEIDKDIYTNVLEYWNSKNIIKHKMNESIEKQIKKSLKDNTFNQITLYIDRYSQVINDENYFFKTKWTLIEFLKQKNAMNDFKDDGSKWVNYCNFYQNDKRVDKTKPYNWKGVSNYGCESEEI